jgi:putative ABC transport system permease protein
MTAPATTLPPSRLLPRDVLQVGSIGLRTRKLRAGLSALGVAIGIASMVAVLGISASSQEELLSTIDRLGTNLLTVEPGQSVIGGGDSELPEESRAKVAAIPGVEAASALYDVEGATVRRNELVDEASTSGITVYAADANLPETMSAQLASGTFLSDATGRFATVVLGSVAARRLGVTSTDHEPQVWIDDRYYTVIGILEPVTLDEGVDRSAMIGLPWARDALGAGADPAKIQIRVRDDAMDDVRSVVAGTANFANPEEVSVSRPSDALEARAAAEGAFTSLFLGLGAVALLVGGVGIANVMVISVLERRSEIGLRRALGATRRHITAQFLCESLLLAGMGGVVGALLGAAATAVSSAAQDQPVVVPPEAIAGGILAALVIGAVAGLYPSIRAARLSPTEALRSV